MANCPICKEEILWHENRHLDTVIATKTGVASKTAIHDNCSFAKGIMNLVKELYDISKQRMGPYNQ